MFPSEVDIMQSKTSTTHPFLPPSRASTISSWTSSIPDRPHHQTDPDKETMSKNAAIEAYRQLKLAIFFKAQEKNV
jgi:hypothetical protein